MKSKRLNSPLELQPILLWTPDNLFKLVAILRNFSAAQVLKSQPLNFCIQLVFSPKTQTSMNNGNVFCSTILGSQSTLVLYLATEQTFWATVLRKTTSV